MDLDIRKHVINNIKNDNKESIIKVIDEGVQDNDELALPGLGVILELFWLKLSQNEKEKIANIIIKELHSYLWCSFNKMIVVPPLYKSIL